MKPFFKKVYNLLRKVPRGRITTYKELANALGTKAYRAVGQALRKNPYAPEVPCHRVVCSDGTIGGYRGETKGKEIGAKKRILIEEGIIIEGNKVKNFEEVLFRFN